MAAFRCCGHQHDSNLGTSSNTQRYSRSYTSLSTGLQCLLLACSSSIRIVYVALHLIAWQVPFTSQIQRVLWRASSIFVTIYVPISCLTIFCTIMYLSLIKGKLESLSHRVVLGLLILLCLLYFIFFVFARVYLLLECFISLPYPPKEVYEQPQ